MVNQTLELRHKKIAQEAAQKAAKEMAKEIAKETVISMLMEMKEEGMPKQAIARIAKGRDIPEDELKKILGD